MVVHYLHKTAYKKLTFIYPKELVRGCYSNARIPTKIVHKSIVFDLAGQLCIFKGRFTKSPKGQSITQAQALREAHNSIFSFECMI